MNPPQTNIVRELEQASHPEFQSFFLDEPSLQFAGGGRSVDPKTGIALYGPISADGGASVIRVGIVGTGRTIDLALAFLEKCKAPIHATAPTPEDNPDYVLFPSFPGVSPSSAFKCEISSPGALHQKITENEIDQIKSETDIRKRVLKAVGLVVERMKVLQENENPPHVVLCAMPMVIDEYCNVGSTRRPGVQRAAKLTDSQKSVLRKTRSAQRKGQMFLFDVRPSIGVEEKPSEQQFYSFHRFLKAYAMEVPIPTQLVWEKTLLLEGTQDAATVAWNFCVALHYKAQGNLWRAPDLTKGTCFLGISFFKDRTTTDSMMRSSIAQAFSDQGDGLVLRGEPFRWTHPKERSPHLDREGAERLVRQVLDVYKKHWHQYPARLVIHKSSRYWPEELAGFRAATADISTKDFLTLGYRGIQFMRMGFQPPIRGTQINLGQGNFLLYTRGYVPYLRTYPGMRIPHPLEVLEHYGDSSHAQLGAEIMALSKLNWNTADFACAEPMTLAFAREVGYILAEVPPGREPQRFYRFYM